MNSPADVFGAADWLAAYPMVAGFEQRLSEHASSYWTEHGSSALYSDLSTLFLFLLMLVGPGLLAMRLPLSSECAGRIDCGQPECRKATLKP